MHINKKKKKQPFLFGEKKSCGRFLISPDERGPLVYPQLGLGNGWGPQVEENKKRTRSWLDVGPTDGTQPDKNHRRKGPTWLIILLALLHLKVHACCPWNPGRVSQRSTIPLPVYVASRFDRQRSTIELFDESHVADWDEWWWWCSRWSRRHSGNQLWSGGGVWTACTCWFPLFWSSTVVNALKID